jgi:hypothetical protein
MSDFDYEHFIAKLQTGSYSVNHACLNYGVMGEGQGKTAFNQGGVWGPIILGQTKIKDLPQGYSSVEAQRPSDRQMTPWEHILKWPASSKKWLL